MRINKFVARAVGISRRQADNLIRQGRVKVDGMPVNLGKQISVQNQVTFDDKLIQLQKLIYLAMHKPVGYVCSRKRQGSSQTIYELLDKKYKQLKTVGRLDKNSSGLILLTNDGDFAQTMTHPKYNKVKVYLVKLKNPLSATDIKRLASGVELEDGLSVLDVSNTGSEYRVVMHEGRNRQIRRTFSAIGNQVKSLHRIQFGNYQLGRLGKGKTKIIKKP